MGGPEPAKPDWTWESRGPEDTRTLATEIARRLRGGEVLLLEGPLGAGKSLFVEALARALGIRGPILSPSFVLHRPYRAAGGLELHHLDFYRLDSAQALETLGIEELLDERSTVAVEWADRRPEAFPDFTLRLRFVVTGENARRIEGLWGALPFQRDPAPRRAASP